MNIKELMNMFFFFIGSMTRSFDNQLEREGGRPERFFKYLFWYFYLYLKPFCKRWTMKAKGRGSGAEGRGRGRGEGGSTGGGGGVDGYGYVYLLSYSQRSFLYYHYAHFVHW